MSNQRFTIEADIAGRTIKQTGLTFKRAKGLTKDLAVWGALQIHMRPEPSLVWSALTETERKERSRFWQRVVVTVCLIGIAEACIYGIGRWAIDRMTLGTNLDLPPYSMDEFTGEVIK